MKRNFAFILSGLFVILLSGCVSLASDITPPPNAESYSANETPVAVESVFPIVPPDPNNGQAIFTEKCAPCHGELGMGDGPQSANLPVPVAPLGNSTLAAASRPVDWYNMVTNGNLERYMPGFASLDDRQRWDVVAYALNLSLSQDAIAAGKEIYTTDCVSCHGEQGTGGSKAPDWQAESGRLAQLSLEEIATVTKDGTGDMPGFSTNLSATDLTAVAQYVRQISFAASAEVSAATLAPVITEASVVKETPGGGSPTLIPTTNQEPLPQPNVPDTAATPVGTPVSEVPTEITVTGKITAAESISIPSGLKVTLVGFDAMSQVFEDQADVKSDGSYVFNNVEFVTGRAFMATVDYNGLTFSSEVYHGTEGVPVASIDLPIPYYETTSDLSALRADRLHLFFDFTRTEFVQVVELFILNNTGDKAIVSTDGKGSVAFELPDGATNLQFQDSTIGERYIQTDKGFADSAAILPGQGTQILFAYDLPYSRKADIAVALPIPVDAAVVMVPEGSVKLTSDQLQSTGSRQVQGVNLEMFTASNLPADSTLEMTLSGRISSTATVETGSSTGLIIGGGVLGLALVGAGIWLWRQKKQDDVDEDEETEPLPGEESRESIMDAIITLDDRFQAGELAEDAYKARRAELKAKLVTLAK